MFNAFFQGGPLMPEQRPFNTQLRCYSAPFFESADSNKINELNHGGKDQAEKIPLAGSVERLPIIVDADYKPGHLSFIRYDYRRRDLLLKDAVAPTDSKQASTGGATVGGGGGASFHGEGHTLRGSRKR
uniref:Uncharacterized protein n=1 Tax=Plectus sambesii TaxID=2011161 RepID=A0A914UQ02_9BILA